MYGILIGFTMNGARHNWDLYAIIWTEWLAKNGKFENGKFEIGKLENGKPKIGKLEDGKL